MIFWDKMPLVALFVSLLLSRNVHVLICTCFVEKMLPFFSRILQPSYAYSFASSSAVAEGCVK